MRRRKQNMKNVKNVKKKRGQGDGTIRQRKDGRWEGRYKYNGIPKSIYGKTEEEVYEKLEKITAEITLGTFFEPSKMKLKEWMETWLKDFKKNSIKAKTYESYEQLIRLYINPVIGAIALDKLNNIQIQRMLNNMSVSPRTIKYTATVLKMALKHAVTTGLIQKNHAENISLPKQIKKEAKVLDRESLQKFIEACRTHRLGPAFYLAACTGMRRGEVLALKWQDVDLINASIKVERTYNRVKVFDRAKIEYKAIISDCKTQKSNRVLPILPELKECLELHYTRSRIELFKKGKKISQDTFLFLTLGGNIYNPRSFSKDYYQFLDKTGIKKINFHALRHTFATIALEQGIELKVISELLGHSSVSFTADTYCHVLPNKKRKEIQKLSLILSGQGQN